MPARNKNMLPNPEERHSALRDLCAQCLRAWEVVYRDEHLDQEKVNRMLDVNEFIVLKQLKQIDPQVLYKIREYNINTRPSSTEGRLKFPGTRAGEWWYFGYVLRDHEVMLEVHRIWS